MVAATAKSAWRVGLLAIICIKMDTNYFLGRIIDGTICRSFIGSAL